MSFTQDEEESWYKRSHTITPPFSKCPPIRSQLSVGPLQVLKGVAFEGSPGVPRGFKVKCFPGPDRIEGANRRQLGEAGLG